MNYRLNNILSGGVKKLIKNKMKKSCVLIALIFATTIGINASEKAKNYEKVGDEAVELASKQVLNGKINTGMNLANTMYVKVILQEEKKQTKLLEKISKELEKDNKSLK